MKSDLHLYTDKPVLVPSYCSNLEARIKELEDGLRKIYEKADIRGYEGGHAGIAYWCEKLLNLPRQR